MNPQKASKLIKELLDAIPQKKTNKEKLLQVFKIRVLLDMIEEPLKKREKKEAALVAQKQIIKKALGQFLAALDKAFGKHPELGDSDVRDRLDLALHKGFIKPERGYQVPTELGMFSKEGNAMVRAALQNFFNHPEVVAARKALKTPEDRLIAFQDEEVESREGTTFFQYFPSSKHPRFP